MILVLSGLHGTGKSTIAQRLAEHFGATFYSTGMAFRELAQEKKMNLAEFSKYAEEHKEIDKELDQKLINLAKKGKEIGKSYIFDGQLPAYLLGDLADYKILLECDDKIRIQRMAKRDGQDLESQLKETMAREESERARFIELYNIDVRNPENIKKTYDLVVDTTDKSIDEVYEICLENVKKALNI